MLKLLRMKALDLFLIYLVELVNLLLSQGCLVSF